MVARILVVDCDVHQGDGTARIFAGRARGPHPVAARRAQLSPPARPPRTSTSRCPTASATAPTSRSSPTRSPPPSPSAPTSSSTTPASIRTAGDRLGRLALTDAGLRARDALVLGWARARGLPLAGVLGGGYDDDPHRLAARHAILFEEAARAAAEA